MIPDQVGYGLATHGLETLPGLSLHVGVTALSGGNTGALVVAPPADSTYTHASGVFDFEIHGVQSGGVASIVIPLQSALPAGATYREYSASNSIWSNFTSMNADAISSAPAQNGVCPGPDSSSWTVGLSATAQCLRLTMTDGGPNDADGTANGVITNFGGAATVTSSSSSSSSSDGKASKGGGGALGWPLLSILSILTIMVYLRRRPLSKN